MSEACWVHLLLDGGAWEPGFIPPLPCLLWKSPKEETKLLVYRQPALSLFTSRRGAFVQSYLPPCKGSLRIQWEPNRLHLFCLSLKHSFLVLTGNNLAGISN